MVDTVIHKNIDKSHAPYSKTYPTEADRLADTSLVSTDVYKKFFQLSTLTEHILLEVNPNVWRSPEDVGNTEYHIFDMNDFPAPVGGVITLQSGKYIIKNTLSTASRFEIPAGSFVTFTMEDQRYNTITYTGTGTFFSGTGFNFFVMEKNQIILTGNGAKMFDLEAAVGALIVFNFKSGRISFQGSGASIGTIKSAFCRIHDMNAVGFDDGLELSNCSYIYITDAVMQGSGGSATYLNILDSLGFLIVGAGNALFTQSGESCFYFDPILQGTISISNTLKIGNGDFYKPGTTGSIASFADVSTSPTAVTATDSGGDAQFNAVAHGLVVGETAVHTTFTQSAYNGSHVVTSVTADTYEVGLAYVADDSGLFETTTTQVNSTAHGLSNDTSLSIFDTINFGGGYKIFNVQTNSFEITLGKAFPGSETTGEWDTGSLTGCYCKRSKYVTALNNGDEPNSKIIGSLVVGGNTAITNIVTQGVFVDMNLNALAQEASNIELWKLTDTTKCILRYDGLTTVNLNYTANIAASSAGGAQRFDFRLMQKPSGGAWAQLPSPDNVDVPIDVNGYLRASPLLWAIQATPGDEFKIMVANIDGVSDITIDTVKVMIQ